MLINIGEKFVISTDMTDDGPICRITFPISDEDCQYFLRNICLDNLSFVVHTDRRGENL